jgi:hypothetical protein
MNSSAFNKLCAGRQFSLPNPPQRKAEKRYASYKINYTMREELEKLKEEIQILKRRNRLFSIIFIPVLIIVLALSFLVTEKDSFDRITAKEIIVIDENGNDRIIMSSSISTSKSRLRADTLEGILILDKNGTDRIVLGATPTIQSNGNIVKRVDNSNPIGFTLGFAPCPSWSRPGTRRCG